MGRQIGRRPAAAVVYGAMQWARMAFHIAKRKGDIVYEMGAYKVAARRADWASCLARQLQLGGCV